jgi:hypothetical protein
MRESGPAFFTSLSLHSLAMGFVVGINFAIALGILGFIPRFNPRSFDKFFTLHWYACLLILLSGLALLLAYPAKALTNPVFFAKLIALSSALLITFKFQKQFFSEAATEAGMASSSLKPWATLSIFLWVATITMGRFLAYTHEILLASRFF